MSTIARSASPSIPATSMPVVPVPPDLRWVVPDATWDLYDRMSDAIGDGHGVRLAFDGQSG